MVYIYQAELYCDECGEGIQADLRYHGFEPEDPNDETTYDSGDFPKGPFPPDTSDYLDFCGGCGEFLGNNLSEVGVDYTAEHVRDFVLLGHGDARYNKIATEQLRHYRSGWDWLQDIGNEVEAVRDRAAWLAIPEGEGLTVF